MILDVLSDDWRLDPVLKKALERLSKKHSQSQQ
jgi:hypothetical protein